MLEGWLADDSSLTAKLIAHCRQFRVQRLHQVRERCLGDEAGALALVRAQRTWEREVLLRCDQKPVVFAHSVVPLSCTAADWPLFRTLGERSLGTILFDDPQVVRGSLHYASIWPAHPLYQRARLALAQTQDWPGAATLLPSGSPLSPLSPLSPQELPPLLPLPPRLFARRSLFQRRQGILLVTELFLPALATLAANRNEAQPSALTRQGN
jgi:chorismate--pyruvate lyase